MMAVGTLADADLEAILLGLASLISNAATNKDMATLYQLVRVIQTVNGYLTKPH